MADVRTQPLMAEQGAIRVDPYSQPSSLPPSVERSAGLTQQSGAQGSSPAANPDVNQDGELDAEELGHLQDAAANGDKESWDMLNALKLPLGVAAGAAALYGAARGGLALTDAVMKSRGASVMGGSQVGQHTVDPSNRVAGLLTGPSNRVAPPPTQQLLPAPHEGPIPGQAPPGVAALEDMRTPYTKSGGKLPTGAAGSEALKAAAQALRRMH